MHPSHRILLLAALLIALAPSGNPAWAGQGRFVKSARNGTKRQSLKVKTVRNSRVLPSKRKAAKGTNLGLVRTRTTKAQAKKNLAGSTKQLEARTGRGAAREKTLAPVRTANAKNSGKAKTNRGFGQREKVVSFRNRFEGDREEVLASQAADSHVQAVMRHSETHGRYHIVSDLHWGKGRLGGKKKGEWDPQEDFRKSESFAKFVGQIAKSKKNTSLVIGGDWLELMEHVDANAPLAEVKDKITKIVEGHAVETKAIAKAVTGNGLRVLYLAGNHDVHLVDGRVRDHLIAEMARVGGVPKSKRSTFAARIAYSGHGAVLGKFGEGMVVHGHAQDASNNWRSVLNPYNAKRELQSNLGWNIVARIYRGIEKRSPEIDNVGKGSTKEVAKRVFTSPRYIAQAATVIWGLLGRTKHFGRAGKLSERLDDRRTMRLWEKRTGFAKKMKEPIPGAKKSSTTTFARTIESIYQGAPKPLHETMRTPSRLVNFFVALFNAPRSIKQVKNSEPTLLARMTGELTNVRYVVWGHNHKEAVVTGTSSKGEVGHYNTGTWTKTHGEWRLNVVSGSTNGEGRLKMDGVFRTELASGSPTLPNKYDSSEARPVPGWKN